MTTGSNLTISNITIQNGNALKGGGIYNHNGVLTISNSIIINNEATGASPNGRGAGIYSKGSGGSASVLIQNSTISLNSASVQGGGISNRNNSLLSIKNSSILGNTSNGNGSGVYNSSSANLSISSSSISGNTSNGNGGGIVNFFSANLSISSSSISGNTSSGNGGGIFNYSSANLSISSSSILGNTSDNGGGIYNSSSANLSISSSSISGNTSNGNGGGIVNFLSTNLSISNSSISENTSSNNGGGIYNHNSDNTLIQASSITLNSATTGVGGGISINCIGSDAVSIINTTISSNETSTSIGGGIYAQGTGGGNTLSLQHVTMSDNSGTVTGGFASNGAIDITIQNSIIANSTGFDFDLGGASIIVTASIIENSTTPITSATVIDPMLNALAGGVHTLQAGSPAIDAASSTVQISTDQLGALRGTCFPDIGAIERAGGSNLVFSAPANITNTWIGCTSSDWNTASNWSTGVIPTASDVVYIPIEASNQLIINEVATCAKFVQQIGAVVKVDYNVGGKLVIKF
jgi:hypothetical protein